MVSPAACRVSPISVPLNLPDDVTSILKENFGIQWRHDWIKCWWELHCMYGHTVWTNNCVIFEFFWLLLQSLKLTQAEFWFVPWKRPTLRVYQANQNSACHHAMLGMAIPWRFSLLEESRNGNLPFLEDRGRKNLFLGVLGEFRGMGCYFILLIFQDLLVFLELLSAL